MKSRLATQSRRPLNLETLSQISHINLPKQETIDIQIIGTAQFSRHPAKGKIMRKNSAEWREVEDSSRRPTVRTKSQQQIMYADRFRTQEPTRPYAEESKDDERYRDPSIKKKENPRYAKELTPADAFIRNFIT